MSFPVKNVTKVSPIFKVMLCYTITVRQGALTQGLCYWIYSTRCKKKRVWGWVHTLTRLYEFISIIAFMTFVPVVVVYVAIQISWPHQLNFYLWMGAWKRIWY